MPTHAGERRGLGAAAKLVSERASSLVRLELQLAAAELKQKVVALGLRIALLMFETISASLSPGRARSFCHSGFTKKKR